MGDKILENRKYVIGGIALCIVVAYIIRLLFLQMLSSDYKVSAENNALHKKIIFPARGAIYDRNGELLVYNQSAYDLMVVPREAEDVDVEALCHTLGIDREEYERRMESLSDLNRNPGYSPNTQQLFMSQIPATEFSVLQEKLFRFPGFYVRNRAIRQYTQPHLAHVIGYVGETSQRDIERDDYYQPGDYIGQAGVERSYEPLLRGHKGVEVQLRDSRGKIQGRYKNGAEDRRPQAGHNLNLSIDIKLQALGERLMEGKLGAIVAIEPSTGEILCMVSSPTYDPRLLVGKDRGNMLMEMGSHPLKPMLNRAIQGVYPPGSTFKPSQGLTFLQEGIITETTPYPCAHGFRFGRFKVGCHSHGSPIPLVPSIATSCNSFFCWGLYHMLSNRQKYPTIDAALTTWKDYMVSMGFGYKLGVDLPGEMRGLIPNAPFYNKALGKWNPLSIISISIGQGEVLLTPLQIANLSATIANRGYYITPHVVRKVEGGSLPDSLTRRHYTNVERKYYEVIVEGMRRAVTGGTCHSANNPWYEVCGKTGTAQNPHGQDHSAFMGFAPRENPKIAICVYVENGRWGATYGVPIGALMMEQYINGKLSPASEAKAKIFQNRHISYQTLIEREIRRQGSAASSGRNTDVSKYLKPAAQPAAQPTTPQGANPTAAPPPTQPAAVPAETARPAADPAGPPPTAAP